jgi:predicted Zn-dependent protease
MPLLPAKPLRAVALALLLPFGVQSADLPDLGESSRGALTEIQEAQLGREIMRQIRADKAYLDDAEITEYLNSLGEKLVAANPDPSRQFQFFGVSDPTINAFALPGGFIGVHTGLISAARNESELAGVLAHEIAHVGQNHIARMVDAQKNNTLVTLAALALAILAARSNSQVSQAAMVGAQAYSVQSQLDFTRENEREADRIGFQTLENSGFAASGMATFFERLQDQGRLYENNAPAYLRTHPLTFERIADMQNRVAEMPYKQHQDSVEFDLVRGKVKAAEGDAKEALRQQAAAAKDRPDDLTSAYAWAASALRARDYPEARRALAQLEKMAQSPMLDTLAARILSASGQRDPALARLKAGMSRYSGAKPLAYAYAETLLSAGRPGEAKTFLLQRQRLWPEDVTLYSLLSRANHELGRRAEGHLAQAEAYLRQDLASPAREQLELARKAGDGDFYTLSVVDARMRQVRELEVAQSSKTKPR